MIIFFVYQISRYIAEVIENDYSAHSFECLVKIYIYIFDVLISF
jgi:hypothetical protein